MSGEDETGRRSVPADDETLAHELLVCNSRRRRIDAELREESTRRQEAGRRLDAGGGAVAAPRPTRRADADAGSNRVQGHVPRKLEEMRVRLDKRAVEAVLEDVADEVVSSIEPLRVPEVEVVHPERDVRLRGLDDEVIVVVHQAVRVAVPPPSPDHPFEEQDEPRTIDVVPHDRRLAVPA